MAQKITQVLVDDLDGSEADETVTFALDGVQYVIDLSGENAEKLRDRLHPYIQAARRSGGRRRVGKLGQSPAATVDIKAARQWGKENGYELSDRGRVPREVLDEYQQAMKTKPRRRK